MKIVNIVNIPNYPNYTIYGKDIETLKIYVSDLLPNDSEEYNKNKEIIINNAFALASKKLKKDLQEKFISITDYLTDNKYSLASSLLVDLSTALKRPDDDFVKINKKFTL